MVVWDIIGKNYDSTDRRLGCPPCGASALATRFATFDFPMYNRSWLTAAQLLREARTWVFIGYSLPAADYEFKYLLKHVQLTRQVPPELVLITGGTGAASTQENYQKFFGPKTRKSGGNYFQNG